MTIFLIISVGAVSLFIAMDAHFHRSEIKVLAKSKSSFDISSHRSKEKFQC